MTRTERISAATAIMTVMGTLWLALFPLLHDGSYAHITHAKWLFALILGGVGVVLALAATLTCLLCRNFRSSVRLSPLQLLALTYLLWIAISAWCSPMASTLNSRGEPVVWTGAIRYEGLSMHLCYLTIFFTMSLYTIRPKPLTIAAAAGLLIFCGIAAVQYTGVNVFGLFPEGRSIYRNYEFQSTIGNIDLVSCYVTLAVPLTLGSFVLRKHAAAPLLLLAGLVGVLLQLCMEVQSGLISLAVAAGLLLMLLLRRPDCRVRGLIVLAGGLLCLTLRLLLGLPWLDGCKTLTFPHAFAWWKLLPALVASALLGLAYLCRRHPGRALSLRVVLALATAFVLVALIAVAVLPVPQSMGGVYELHEVLNGRPEDHYGSWRLGAWRHTLHMAPEHLLFGTGPDTYLYALHDHLQAEGATLGENYDNPHNEYLAILSNNGLPALLLYLALLAWTVVRSIRRGGNWGLVLAAAILCYAVQGMFCFSLCTHTPVFWAVMGMAAGSAAPKEALG